MRAISFLCSGNICRSACCEAVLKRMIGQYNLTGITVNSMGTTDVGCQPRDGIMARIATNHGYDMSGFSTFMDKDTLMQSDLILVMTYSHLVAVQSILPYERWHTIKMFNQYCFGIEEPLNDPSYMPENVYMETFKRIERGCCIIVERLKADVAFENKVAK